MIFIFYKEHMDFRSLVQFKFYPNSCLFVRSPYHNYLICFSLILFLVKVVLSRTSLFIFESLFRKNCSILLQLLVAIFFSSWFKATQPRKFRRSFQINFPLNLNCNILIHQRRHRHAHCICYSTVSSFRKHLSSTTLFYTPLWRFYLNLFKNQRKKKPLKRGENEIL